MPGFGCWQDAQLPPSLWLQPENFGSSAAREKGNIAGYKFYGVRRRGLEQLNLIAASHTARHWAGVETSPENFIFLTGSLGWEMGVTLADKVYAKHLADGVISRLYTGWRMLTGLYVTGHKLDTCLQKHKLAERLRIDPETAYRKRDHLYEEVTQILRVNKNALKGKFTLNLKKIGAWGFEIDDTPPVKKIKPKQ